MNPVFAADDYSQYRRLESQAKLYTNLGRPARAAQAWLDAYEQYPDEHALIRAIEAYRAASLDEKALRVAERYLRLGKVPSGRLAARKHLDQLRTMMSTHSAEYQIVTVPADSWICLQRPGNPKQDCMPGPILRWLAAGDLIIHATTKTGVNRTHRLTVKAGKHLKVTLPVQLPVTRGLLDVYSRGKGHQVLVDGIPRGVTPLVGLEVASGRHVVSVAVDPEKSWLSEVMVRTGRTTTVYAGSAPPENPTNRDTVSLGSKHIKSLPPVIVTQRRLSVPVRLAGPTRVGNVGGPMVAGTTAKPVKKKPVPIAKAPETPIKPVERPVAEEEPLEVVPPSEEASDDPMDVDVVPLPIPQEDDALEVAEVEESEPVELPEENMPMEANDDAELLEEETDDIEEMESVPMPADDSESEEDFMAEVDEPLAEDTASEEDIDDSLSSSNASMVSDETSVAWESVTGWTSIGVGLALVGGAVATSVLAMNAVDEANALSPTAPGYDNDFARLQDQAESQAMWTNILMPTGAALVAAGIALVWIAPDTPAAPAVALDETHRLEFQAIPQSGGVLVTTRLDF